MLFANLSLNVMGVCLIINLIIRLVKVSNLYKKFRKKYNIRQYNISYKKII
jgi:hypothetical protein